MKIIHRVGINANSTQRQQLEMLGIPSMKALPSLASDNVLLTFDIDEMHPSWSVIKELIEQWGCSDIARTVFSAKEIESAPWLAIRPWVEGYPQPEDGGYRDITFDLSHWCRECGVGKVQRAAFRMNGEPRWGKHAMLQLFWIFDEIFVTPELWAAVFQPRGIGQRSVLDLQGRELRTVVQLTIEEHVGVITEGLNFALCATCGRIKYRLGGREQHPALAEEPRRPIVTTREYFGGGGQADRYVIVSQDVVRALNAANVRGIHLEPLRRGDASDAALS